MLSTTLSPRQIMNRLYKDISGFEIPKTEEKAVRTSKGSPLYGEINHQALNKLLDHLRLNRNDVFFDLGSGVGKVILQTALLSPVKKAVGIELSKTRFLEAQEALRRAKVLVPAINDRCLFKNADLMTADLSQATVIYTCSTAFSLAFMKRMCKKFSELPHRFRLVTLQDLPTDKDFSLEDTLRLDMSWCRSTPVYIYRRQLTGRS